MAAMVESMFSNRETPWHGLGTIVKEAQGSREAIQLGGIAWDVIQKPVYLESGNPVPGYYANVRDIDEAVLGVVTKKYKIVQNSEAFAFTDALLGEGVRYETAGSLESGKRIWLLARMDTATITDEKVDPYLVFTNNHDGKGAVRVALTPIRVVCQNTLNLAMASASRHWSCAHMGNIDGKMEDAKNTLFNANRYMEALEEEFGELKMQKLTDSQVEAFINMLLPYSDVDDPKRKIENIKAMREEVLYRYMFAPDLKPIEKSAYRFINAVSDFATHTDLHRKTRNYRENLFMKTADGISLIDRAYDIVKDAA